MESGSYKQAILEEMFSGWLADNGYVRRPPGKVIAFKNDSEDLVNKFFEDFDLGETEAEEDFTVEDAIELLNDYTLLNEPWFSIHNSTTTRKT